MNENFWNYRLHKLGTPKVLRTDVRTDGVDPLLDLCFPKATQVKIYKLVK